MFENSKTNHKHTRDIKLSYLSTTLGDETRSQKKKNLKRKLEAFGFDNKVVNRLVRQNLTSNVKNKRFRSNGANAFKDSKVTNVLINKRSINYILKKQIQIIGRKRHEKE